MIAGRIIDTLYGLRSSGPHAGETPGVRTNHCGSSVRRLKGELLRDFALPTVAVREQLFLVVEKLLAGLGGELQIRPLDNRIDRTGLLAIAAIDAFRHVDVVARRPSAAVLARLGFNRDAQRRADRLAQFACDAAFLAVRI